MKKRSGLVTYSDGSAAYFTETAPADGVSAPAHLGPHRDYGYIPPEEKAQKQNLIIITPTPNELFVDIDTKANWNTFQRNVAILIKYIPLTWDWTKSKSYSPVKTSPSHWKRHVTVTLSRPVKDEIERIAMQAILGSDVTRELCSYIDVLKQNEYTTVFFENATLENIAERALSKDGVYGDVEEAEQATEEGEVLDYEGDPFSPFSFHDTSHPLTETLGIDREDKALVEKACGAPAPVVAEDPVHRFVRERRAQERAARDASTRSVAEASPNKGGRGRKR